MVATGSSTEAIPLTATCCDVCGHQAIAEVGPCSCKEQISVATATTHRRNILSKLNLHSTKDLQIYAEKTGLFSGNRAPS